MRSRRKARETALQALYQCDSLNDWSAESVSLFFTSFVDKIIEDSELFKGNFDFARELIFGVINNLSLIDSQIGLASTHWSLRRMARVDRNILRIAAYEIGYLSDIPVSVSIDEAIEIAKRYGAVDSPMFINGVLDNIAEVLAGHPELKHTIKIKVANQ